MNINKKNLNKNYSLIECVLKNICENRINKQKDVTIIHERIAESYVKLIVELFDISTQESKDFLLDTLLIDFKDNVVQLYWKSPIIDGILYGLYGNFFRYSSTTQLTRNDILSILRNMPNTKKKMQEIENISPTKTVLSDINAILQKEPFCKYFQTKESPTSLYITFNSEICEKNKT